MDERRVCSMVRAMVGSDDLSAMSMPEPRVETIEGSITQVDLDSRHPTVALVGHKGETRRLAVHCKSTHVWQHDRRLALTQLRPGLRVLVHRLIEGRQTVVRDVEIVEPFPLSSRSPDGFGGWLAKWLDIPAEGTGGEHRSASTLAEVIVG